MITKHTTTGASSLGNFVNTYIGKSTLRYNVTPDIHTLEYYKYCTRLLAQCLETFPHPLNVIFGRDEECTYMDFKDPNPVLRVDIQPEHTLVKEGGRSVSNVIKGGVKTLDGPDNYLVRIQDFDYYNTLDHVFEYSIPNLVNMKSSNKTKKYASKCSYIAPVIYEDINFASHRRFQTFTLFSDNPCPRRAEFSKSAKVTNISECFTKEQLRTTYFNSKILVNIHQTDHHHTFEELRVLPALCNGVLILSEDVPLKDYIPYADSILWAPYSTLQDNLIEVEQNFKKYHEQIFTDELRNKLQSLDTQNIETINNILWQNKQTESN